MGPIRKLQIKQSVVTVIPELRLIWVFLVPCEIPNNPSLLPTQLALSWPQILLQAYNTDILFTVIKRFTVQAYKYFVFETLAIVEIMQNYVRP